MSLIFAKEWMKAAYDDICVLHEIIRNPYLTNVVAFHAEQAIEKSLKALLLFMGKDVPKIHSLNKLLKICEDKLVCEQIDTGNKLDKLYIDSRYPADLGLLPYGKPTLEDAKEFYEFAQSIFDAVCAILGIDKNELQR